MNSNKRDTTVPNVVTAAEISANMKFAIHHSTIYDTDTILLRIRNKALLLLSSIIKAELSATRTNGRYRLSLISPATNHNKMPYTAVTGSVALLSDTLFCNSFTIKYPCLCRDGNICQ